MPNYGVLQPPLLPSGVFDAALFIVATQCSGCWFAQSEVGFECQTTSIVQ